MFLRKSSTIAGQGESQRLIIHPARLSRIFHVDRVGRSGRSGRSLCLIAGIVGFADSKQNHSDREVDEAGDQGGDPFGPTKDVKGLDLLEVEVYLLEDVLGFKMDHAGLVPKLVDGILELRLLDVLQDPLSVPSPVEDLVFGTGKDHRFFTIDLVIFQSDVASG